MWEKIWIPILVGLTLAAIKWLSSDWFAKSKELQNQKEAENNRTINKLMDQVKAFNSTVNNLRSELEQLKITSAVTNSEMKMLKEQLTETVKKIEQYSKDFDGKIANRIKTELIELGKQAKLFRDKKNGT